MHSLIEVVILMYGATLLNLRGLFVWEGLSGTNFVTLDWLR